MLFIEATHHVTFKSTVDEDTMGHFETVIIYDLYEKVIPFLINMFTAPKGSHFNFYLLLPHYENLPMQQSEIFFFQL